MKARYSKEIDRLYLQMYPKLFEYARCSLSNDAQAEEAVQDTFIIACQKPEALCDCPSPEGWLFNTLKNVISNTIRSQNIARRILLDYFASNAKDISISDDRVGLEILYDDVADSEEFKLLKGGGASADDEIPGGYRLEWFSVSTSNMTTPTCVVRLSLAGQSFEEACTGEEVKWQ